MNHCRNKKKKQQQQQHITHVPFSLPVKLSLKNALQVLAVAISQGISNLNCSILIVTHKASQWLLFPGRIKIPTPTTAMLLHERSQEPMSRSMQLHYNPVTAFS